MHLSASEFDKYCILSNAINDCQKIHNINGINNKNNYYDILTKCVNGYFVILGKNKNKYYLHNEKVQNIFFYCNLPYSNYKFLHYIKSTINN